MDFRERVTCTVKQACEATGLGPTTIGEAVRDGRIRSKLVEGRRLLDVPSVLEFVKIGDDAGYKPSQRGFTAQQRQRALAENHAD